MRKYIVKVEVEKGSAGANEGTIVGTAILQGLKKWGFIVKKIEVEENKSKKPLKNL